MSAHESDLVVALRPLLSAFKKLGIEYCIGGSVAGSLHGWARATMDVDIMVRLEAGRVSALVRALKDVYYLDENTITAAVANRGTFNLVHYATSFKVDIFVAGASPHDSESLRRRVNIPLEVESGRLNCRVMSPEDLVLKKLLWYQRGNRVSERQWQDVIGVIRVQSDRLDRSYLNHWATELHLSDLLEKALKEGTE